METNEDQTGDKDPHLREKNFEELMKEIEELEIEQSEQIEDVFSLSDIPEIPSALERSTRPSTPFPTESVASTESIRAKPWKITSSTPRLTFDSTESIKLVEDNESWIRVDITENSTLKVNAGHGDFSYPRNPTPPTVFDNRPKKSQFTIYMAGKLGLLFVSRNAQK